MAHAATINNLVNGLISSVTGLDRDSTESSSLREYALKTLRNQSHVQINQFVVKERLDGLAEKFAVLNRDDLAEAFQSRVDKVIGHSKWTLDVLSLLLELSDRPSEKTKLEVLEGLNRPATPEHQLTWEEVIADDPLEGGDIWDDIERGYHSSGDEDLDEAGSEQTVSTNASSLQEDDAVSDARSLLLKPREGLLDPFRRTHEIWRPPKRRNEPTTLSELVVIREIITMLHGLPTNLFTMTEDVKEVSLSRKVILESTSINSLSGVLRQCARMGSLLNFLRFWISVPQRIAFSQSIQHSVQDLLNALSSLLGEVEQQLISPRIDTAVSAVSILDNVQTFTRPLEEISNLFQQCSNDNFGVLDALYDKCCVSQAIGDQDVHAVVSKVFLAGIQTYLRSVSAWIENGSIPAKDKEFSFISDADTSCDLSELWQSRFAIRLQSDGDPLVPKCLHHLASRMFALGKSRAFLHRLGHATEDYDQTLTVTTSSTDLQTLCRQANSTSLASFPQVLDNALSQWLTATSTDCMPHLCSTLLKDHGLTQILTAIPYVYFSKDSSLFSSFSEAVFERLGPKADKAIWSNQFILTELAQSSLGHAPCVHADNIYVRTTTPESSSSAPPPQTSVQQLGSLMLEYRFPWPIQNIIRAPFSTTHARIFAFLLQLTAATQHLHSPFFSFRALLSPPNSAATSSEPLTSKIFRLRHDLLVFVATFHTYLTSTTDTFHTRTMVSLRAAKSVDAMIERWARYDAALQRLALVSPSCAPLRDAIVGILEICAEISHEKFSALEDAAVGKLEERVEESRRFLVAGLRALSRGGGISGTDEGGDDGGDGLGLELERLAERLDWEARS